MATLNWLVTCHCENPVEYVCNTCGEKLCSDCKEQHLQNSATRHHSITDYAKKLMPGSLSSLPCHDHDGKECICWCQTCGKAVCVDCVTSLHNGHKFTKLETVLQKKRTSLQKELENLESKSLKEWRDLMTEAGQFTSDFLGHVNRIEKELEERAKEFHKRVDEIKENAKKQLNELKTSNLVILREQEKRVSDGLEKVKQEIKECEDRLRSGDVERLLEHEDAQHRKKDILPTVSSVTPPVLSPSHIDIKSLTEMFGQLTVPRTDQGAEGHSPASIDTSYHKHKLSITGSAKKQTVPETTQLTAAGHIRLIKGLSRDAHRSDRESLAPTKPLTQLIPKPSVQSQFTSGSSDPLLACIGSGLAWVEAGDRKLRLVDRHGSVKDTIHTDFRFDDVVLTPQGNILLSDRDNNCIKSISANGTVEMLFKVQWEPRAVCCLHSGDIAVTFYDECRVVIYSMSGKVVKKLDKKLFTSPCKVTQSKVNNDLYISNDGYVLALDKDYRVRYEYTGQGEGESVLLHGLCTDNAGHVLITDFYNHRLHILDKYGKFLQYLLTKDQGLWQPVSIDVDSEGNAWVGDFHGVKVVKYLQ